MVQLLLNKQQEIWGGVYNYPLTFFEQYRYGSLAQSWTWIVSIHGLDRIGLGPMAAFLCFFFIYIFSILTTDNR